MDQEVPPEALQRAEDLWFPDATLILRAENTIFRVHSGIICARSSVFRDMNTFPQPKPLEADTYEGTPVVRLHDTARDVEVFLRAVFDSGFFMPPPSPTDFYTVVGILRLAHKYDVQYLFRRALCHFESVYPTNLSRFLEVNISIADHHVEFVAGDPRVDLAALRAASEVDAPWLLPTIYYSLCVYPRKKLLSGSGWDTLCPDQQQTCLVSPVDMLRGKLGTYRFLRDLPTSLCSSPEECHAAIADARGILDFWIGQKLDVNPLDESVFEHTGPQLCFDCGQFAREEFAEGQKSFWNRMPGIFGLADWAELMKTRSRVMEVKSQ
ncbi:hypothetical protein DFH06DRAFT_440947 [Mycena polygramma]|nr:hypothetical protein DFH06DRAFT_440947 [Mycena polygramma]